jgi:outer membrane protein OmpA-like peptidoglycan-associated protein
MTVNFTSAVRTAVALAAPMAAAFASAQSSDIPIVPGLNVVLAVANATSSDTAPAGILQGDYEMVVTITNVGAGGITHAAWFDGVDSSGVARKGIVSRMVSAADLASAPVQILGFHLADPPRVDGATALGPSLAVTRALVQKGTTPYSFRLWAGRDVVSGTLQRSSNSPVKFPVLVNGQRVELDAIHATGEMAAGGAKRPFETVILDHPTYPLSLRIAYGPRDGGFPFKPDFVREVVRLDFPVPQDGTAAGSGGSGGGGTRSGAGTGAMGGGKAIADALNRECRVELSGIYFDFNLATLNPQSERALKEIASALRTAQRRVTIEGHTDNIGSDRYNDDLSARRAATVKTTLVRDYGIDEAWLSTAGYGERRPIESNDTLAGRARNRRVELVCAR